MSSLIPPVSWSTRGLAPRDPREVAGSSDRPEVDAMARFFRPAPSPCEPLEQKWPAPPDPRPMRWVSSTHGQGATAVPVEPPPPPPAHSHKAPSLAENIFKGLLFLGGVYLAAKATEAVIDSLTSPSEAARQPRRLPAPEPEWEEELLDWKHAELRAEAQVAESYPRAVVARQVRVGSRLEGVRVADVVAYHPNGRATSVEVKHVREVRSRHIEQARDTADKHAADFGVPTGAVLLAPPHAVSARNLATARHYGVKIEPLR